MRPVHDDQFDVNIFAIFVKKVRHETGDRLKRNVTTEYNMSENTINKTLQMRFHAALVGLNYSCKTITGSIHNNNNNKDDNRNTCTIEIQRTKLYYFCR